MADQNIKDFAVNWVLFGLLIFSLLAFTISFIAYNNPDALGDTQGHFEDSYTDLKDSLIEIESSTESQINVSADLQSDESQLGTRAAASTSYGLMDSGTTFWNKSKNLMAFVFSGLMGQIILGVFGTLIAMTALYYIVKLIRSLF
jgi:hypothetical protein